MEESLDFLLILLGILFVALFLLPKQKRAAPCTFHKWVETPKANNPEDVVMTCAICGHRPG